MIQTLLRTLRSRLLGPSSIPVRRFIPQLTALESYSMAGLPALEYHYLLARDVVARAVPGDFVECGVCNGGTAAAAACALRDTDRRLWLYDSFEGLPAPSPVDGPDAPAYAGGCVGSEAKVLEAIALAGFPEGRCVIRKGWFVQTFAQPCPDAVALLHVDADWYDSILLALDTFYDRVVEGGVIILDDFGHWEGCREAFYHFIAKRRLKPLLERFGYSQAYWVKGRDHNREFQGEVLAPLDRMARRFVRERT